MNHQRPSFNFHINDRGQRLSAVKGYHTHAHSFATQLLSVLLYRPGEDADPQQQTRTSTGTFLSTHHDPDGVLAWIEERIAAISMIPRENGEPFNVLHYENMQHYDSHMDSFDPKVCERSSVHYQIQIFVTLSDGACR